MSTIVARRPPRVASIAIEAAIVLVVATTMSSCDRTPRDAVMTGYAEATLVYVGPTTSGVLSRIDVRRSDAVRAGQVLFALDVDAEALAQDAAAARRDAAKSQLSDLGKGRRAQEIQAIDEQIVQARAALAASTSSLARQQGLVKEGFITAARLDELKAARDRDAARVRELQSQRDLAVHASARDDAIAAAAATERGTEADLALAQLRRDQRTRTAPVDAQVFDVMYRAGEVVIAGAPVVALLPPRGVHLRFFVPQGDLARAGVGTTVAVACDGCPTGLTARIRWVAPQAEFTPPVIYAAGTRDKLVFMVEADPSDPAVLKPGQPVDVRFAAALAATPSTSTSTSTSAPAPAPAPAAPPGSAAASR